MMMMTAPAPVRGLGCGGGCGCGCSGVGQAEPEQMPEGSAMKLVLGFGAIVGMMGVAVLIANHMEKT